MWWLSDKEPGPLTTFAHVLEGIVVAVFLLGAGVVAIWRGEYVMGCALLGTLVFALALIRSVSRKRPRNPHRYRKARRARDVLKGS